MSSDLEMEKVASKKNIFTDKDILFIIKSNIRPSHIYYVGRSFFPTDILDIDNFRKNDLFHKEQPDAS